MIRDGAQKGQAARAAFLEFLGPAHLHYYFAEFEFPFVNALIGKKDVLRSVEDSVLPNNITPNQVKEMFG